MVKIKPEEIVGDLDTEFRRALADAVKEVIPASRFDEYSLFRAFQRAVGRRCHTWETVKDSHVEVE